MRVAVFSDVHGNAMALDAVLADTDRAGGVDAFWFVGDSAALGYDPAGSIERLTAIPGLVAVRGNTDRHTVEDEPGANENFVKLAARKPDRAVQTFMIVRGFDWTLGAATSHGQFDWLAGLPLEHRETLPDGTCVLLVHASPGTDDGDGIGPEQSDAELGEILGGAEADLVIVGHTHIPLDRTVDGVRTWNLGSVSNPKTDDTRAMWTLLEADDSGHTLTRQYVTYDIDAMLAKLEAAHHPTAPYIRTFWDGKAR
jgi:predicted phosphodiesterase